MKKLTEYRAKRLFVLLLITGLAAVSAQPQTQPQLKGRDTVSNTEAIIEAVQKMSTAMGQGSLEEVLKYYEPTATLVAQPGMNVSGAAFREAMSGYVSMKPKFEMPTHEVIESGDIALHISPWTMEAIDPSTGTIITQNGLSLAVFRKQENGQWLMVIDNPFGGNLLTH